MLGSWPYSSAPKLKSQTVLTLDWSLKDVKLLLLPVLVQESKRFECFVIFWWWWQFLYIVKMKFLGFCKNMLQIKAALILSLNLSIIHWSLTLWVKIRHWIAQITIDCNQICSQNSRKWKGISETGKASSFYQNIFFELYSSDIHSSSTKLPTNHQELALEVSHFSEVDDLLEETWVLNLQRENISPPRMLYLC